MLDDTGILILAALATFIVPALFLATLAVAGRHRSLGRPVGDGLTKLVTGLGGASLGVMVVMADDPAISWPILVTIVVIGGLLVRSLRIQLLAAFVAGAAAPWAAFGAIAVAALVLGKPLEPLPTWAGFIVGAVLFLWALFVLAARPGPGAGPRVVRDGRRGRSFGDVGAATRAPAFIGPFGLSEVSLLAAIVATWLVLGITLGVLFPPSTVPDAVRVAVLVIVSSVVGAEAYIRAMPLPAREAFEAFSWLGEWELAQVRAATGGGVPTDATSARRWLEAHPETPENRWIRVEMLTFVQRYDDAQAAAERMPDSTPLERFDRAVNLDFVDWFRGGDGDLAGIEAAAAELMPADGDDRLRAEVVIAIAKVRRLMAAGEDPIAAGQPLRDVRKRLGRRAEGQVGRALRIRLIRPLLIVGAVLAALSLLLPDLAPIL
jgi:hypothetical protein